MSSSDRRTDARQANSPQPLDPVTSIQNHPKWFFTTGQFEWQTALGLIETEALHSPKVHQTRVQRVGRWVSFTADGDWLDGDLEAFAKPTIYPEGGTNATRAEVLLSAFCEAVFTASRGQRNDIRTLGEKDIPDSLSAALAEPIQGRIIVFQIPLAKHSDSQSARPRSSNRISEALAEFNELVTQFQNA